MTFVLTRLNEPNNIVDFHNASIYDKDTDSTKDFLVIGRRDALEIHQISPDNKLILRRKIPIEEIILDIKPFQPLGIEGTWFMMSTDDNSMVLLGFHGIQEEVVMHRLLLSEHDYQKPTIKPGTLCVDSGKFVSTLTNEGTVCIFPLHRDKDMKNFVRANVGSRSQKLFEKPVIYTVSSQQGRTPINLERIESHYEQNTDVTFSIVYRDELYNYHHSYFTYDSRIFEERFSLQFPEEISPIIIPLGQNMGSLFFGRTGMYMRGYNGIISTINFSPGLQDLELISLNAASVLIKKPLMNQSSKVMSAVLLNPNDLKTASVMFITLDGTVYLSTLTFKVSNDQYGYRDCLTVKSWSVKRFNEKAFTATKFIKLTDSSFLIHSQHHGVSLFTVNYGSMELAITDRHEMTPPILDVNIAGTICPKVQVIGGGSLYEGFIRTEFQGFESGVVNKMDTKLSTGSFGVWKFDDTYIVRHIEGTQIWKKTPDGELEPCQDFKGLSAVEGDLLDMIITEKDELIAISDMGEYDLSWSKTGGGIFAASFSNTSQDVVVSKDKVRYKQNYYNVSGSGVSSVSCAEYGLRYYILVGFWDGSAQILSEGKVRKINTESGRSIHSVLAKAIGSRVVYFLGTSHGELVYHKDDEITRWSLGSSPVTIINCDKFIIAYNSENVVKLVFNHDAECIKRGFLPVEPPETMSYCDGKVITVNNGIIGELEISPDLDTLKHEMNLPRLVRKVVNFRNFMDMSLFVTMTEVYSAALGKNLVQSQLEVIENNTFTTKSIYRFPEGVEVTDCVNLEYKTAVISTYEEPPIHVGVESFLSQCFAVSCVYHIQDARGSPIMIFSIDKSGSIQHTASSRVSKASYFSLSSHANRLLIAGGDKVCAYHVEYIIEHSKFTINRVSDWLNRKSHAHISLVKSKGPDVFVTDVLGICHKYSLVKKNKAENKVIFGWEEQTNFFSVFGKFPISFDFFRSTVLASSVNSLNTSFEVHEANRTEEIHPSSLKIPDQINVIRAIKFTEDLISANDIQRRLLGESITEEVPPAIPVFVLGSVFGGLYLVTFVTAEWTELLGDPEFVISDELENLTRRIESRGWRYQRSHPPEGLLKDYFIDGEIFKRYGRNNIAQFIGKWCKLP
jgi:hypothetical protein